MEPIDARKSTSVRFAESIHSKVTIIPSREDISEDERSSMWYTGDEIEEIRNSCNELVQKMRAGEVAISEESQPSTTRGLERLGSYLRHSCDLKKKRVITEVLREQRRQRQMQTWDPEALSAISAIHSRCAITLARSRGASDAVAYYELKKDCRICFQCQVRPVAAKHKEVCFKRQTQLPKVEMMEGINMCACCRQEPITDEFIEQKFQSKSTKEIYAPAEKTTVSNENETVGKMKRRGEAFVSWVARLSEVVLPCSSPSFTL